MPSEIGYHNGVLMCEEVMLPLIAAEIGTPTYVYSSAVMTRQYRAFEAAVGSNICFAVKANSNQAVIATFASLGAGADVVSEGEARRALAAGIDPARIVYSGVAKTEAELVFALESGIGQINVESEYELETLSALASSHGRRVRIAIRVNPDVDANTHPKITTGLAENKFGIDIEEAPRLYAKAATLPGIDALAVAVHIGSQLMDFVPYEVAFRRVADSVRMLREQGNTITHLDLGGGVGVPYEGEELADLGEYAAVIQRTVGGLGCSLTFEPGRFLVAEAGLLLSRVIAIKPGATRLLVLQDAAMNDLIRPTLYEAYHPIWPVHANNGAPQLVDVVGPICESGDYLAQERALAPVAAGDLLATGFAGAYGAAMSSTYNTRRLLAEVLVNGADWSVIRPRQSYDELIGLDVVPSWLRR